MSEPTLWNHQQEAHTSARTAFGSGHRSVLIQGVTGTGKTRFVAYCIYQAIRKKSRATGSGQNVWFVVPRRELLWQSGDELSQWGIKNKVIRDSRDGLTSGFQVHVWCTETLSRRIKSGAVALDDFPDLLIIDEAHLHLAKWIGIIAQAPDTLRYMGVTATPERYDRGDLSQLFDVMAPGPQMQWFVEHEFLKRPWVLSVPQQDRLSGLDELKRNAAGEVSAKALTALYAARAKGGKVLYGNEIEHYKAHGQGRSFLVFCRSVEQCKSVAAEFTAAGYPCEDIDGSMTDKQRKRKIDGVKNGALTGLTTVDLCTYGLDVPRISCLIMMRPTDSVALFFQMIGRGLRWDGLFAECLILDHVGNCDAKKHGHPLEPRVWNWTGETRRDKPPDDAVERIAAVGKCQICFDLIINGKCRTCGAVPPVKSRKPLKEVDGWLVEITQPTPLKERPLENRREYQDRQARAVGKFRAEWYGEDGRPGGIIDVESVVELFKIAHDLNWKNPQKQVYYKLVDPEDLTVNVSLLSVIAEIQIDGIKNKYHPKWVEREREFVEAQLSRRIGVA